MHSCIYHGYTAHRRFRPREHRLRYSLYMLYLDIDELQRGELPVSESRFSTASLLRRDQLGDPAVPLRSAVEDVIEAQTGRRHAGPIRLLTQARCFGYYFSPLNLYYCFNDDNLVETIVADVGNTPWNQRHAYVLWEGNRLNAAHDASSGASHRLRYRHPKEFHVSPFMGMDADYDWRLSHPGPRLTVHIESKQTGGDSQCDRFFHAQLVMKQRPLTRANLAWTTLTYPWMTGKIIGGIYYQAFKLWLKKCPYHPHPKTEPLSENQPNGIRTQPSKSGVRSR